MDVDQCVQRRTVFHGLLAGAACLGLPSSAAACGVWPLEDLEGNFVVKHYQGAASISLVRRTETRRYRVRDRLYLLARRDGGIAVYKPTRKRLFEVADGGLKMYGEAVGRLEGNALVVDGISYRFTIEDTADGAYAKVRIYRGEDLVARSDRALRVVCGFGVSLERRLVFHAMWRELVWPEFRERLVETGRLPSSGRAALGTESP